MKHIIWIILALFLTSCFEEDEKVIPKEIEEIAISYSMYEYQTYYNLEDKNIVGYHQYSDWDLGFEASEDGHHIILNYARFMYAGKTGTTDFSSVTSNIADTMHFDHSSGDLSQTVLKDWVDFTDKANPVYSQQVYIIDRGIDESGNRFGLKKLVVEKIENNSYYIRYANLDGTEESTFVIPKDPTVNFVLFSFDQGGNIDTQQPDKQTWDICFTKYSTVIPDNYGTPTPYIVRGVYSNNINGVEAVNDTIHDFYSISLSNISDYDFSNSQDAIGYEWKVFSGDSYTIVDHNSYVVESVNGNYFKIRFTRFYNDEGEKGFPSFELIEL